MEELEGRLKTFELWVRRYGLPGFREYCDNNYYDHEYWRSYTEELSGLAEEMKTGVRVCDKGHYELCSNLYEKIFAQVNRTIAIEAYESLVSSYLKEGFEDLEAKKTAIGYLWKDPRYQYWLPVSLRMTNPEGNQVFLVANKQHTPQGENYVTTSEISFLGNSERNPWEYVSERKAQ